MDAAKTLRSILSVIDKDVKRIKRNASKSNAALEPEAALTLSRYASMLNGILEDGWKAKEKAKRALEKKSTEELVEMYLADKKKKESQ